MLKNLSQNLSQKLSWIDIVVSPMWLFLIVLMITSSVLLKQKGYQLEFYLVIACIIATITYPIYSFGFSPIPSLIGNIAFLTFFSITTYFVFKQDLISGLLLSPTILWVIVATIYTTSNIIVKL